jgi:hypothetical protein
MTKAAQQRGSVTGGAVTTTDGLLPLGSGTQIREIYVWSDGTQVGFSMSAEGPFYTGGLAWQYRVEELVQYSLFMTFVFLGEAEQVVSTRIALSPPGERGQLGCVRPASDDFDFNVQVRAGRKTLIDPRMVITPL